MGILSTLESINFDESIKYASKWIVLARRMQNLELVNIKCFTYIYTCTTHLGPLKGHDRYPIDMIDRQELK